MTRELTGRDVFLITAGAFGIIIGVNVLMAVKAVGTFPGLEVKNSYVASQEFTAHANAQAALGWHVETRLDEGRIVVTFPDQGGPVSVEGDLGRATLKADDVVLAFTETAPGRWEAPADPGRGRWVMHLTATAPDGTDWRQRVSLTVMP